MTYKHSHLLLFLVLVFSILQYNNAFSKSCGQNCTYTIDEDGNVIVTSSGDGVLTGLSVDDRTKVTTLIVSDGIKKIDSMAFWYSGNIKSVDLASSVETVGSNAFYGKKNLDLTIRGNTNIGSGFNESTFNNLNFSKLSWSCGSDCTATLDNTGSTVFSGTGSLNNVRKELGSYIKNVEVKEGITDVASMAFWYSGNIKSVDLASSVETVGSNAFYGKKNIDLTLQGENTNIGSGFNESTFNNLNFSKLSWSCGSDCTATLDSEGNAIFSGTGSLNNVRKELGSYIKNVEVKEGITDVASMAFWYSGNIKSVDLASSVETVGSNAFYGKKDFDLIIRGSNTNLSAGFNAALPNSVTYTDGGTTENYVLNHFPNAKKIRIFGPRRQWTVAEAVEAIEESHKRGYKPNHNTIVIKFR